MRKDKNTAKKLSASVATIMMLSICLCITTFALVWATVRAENSFFHMGKVEINLNNGQPVIEEHEFLFEPGMTVKKDFFIENKSTWDVYYKLYFDNVTGGLVDILKVQISDGNDILFEGTPSELSEANVSAADDVLRLREKKELQIVFHFPESAQNTAQNSDLTFDFCAKAVQTKNNPNKEFN